MTDVFHVRYVDLKELVNEPDSYNDTFSTLDAATAYAEKKARNDRDGDAYLIFKATHSVAGTPTPTTVTLL